MLKQPHDNTCIPSGFRPVPDAAFVALCSLLEVGCMTDINEHFRKVLLVLFSFPRSVAFL